MNIKRIGALLCRQWFLIQGNTVRLINILYWTLLDLLLWGFITKYLDSASSARFSFFTVILGAVVLWNFLIRVSQGMTVAFLEDVWSRNFLNLFASPLTITEYVLSLMAATCATSTLSLTVMLGFVWLLFGYNFFTLGLLAFPFLIILFLFGLSIGTFVTGLVLRLGPSAEWLAWPIPFLFSPLSGVFYPISALPKILQPISRIVPASYVFENLRSVLLHGTASWSALAIGFFLAFLYLAGAYFFLVHVYKRVLRNGLLSRFTAESS